MNQIDLKEFLDSRVLIYNQPGFIEHDPISIPHLFKKKQDIEIAGLFAAVLAWGQRVTIINKCTELLNYMGNSPHDFVINYSENDLKPFLEFKHRTFMASDTLYFIHFLNWFYTRYNSLEDAFCPDDQYLEPTVEQALSRFYHLFFHLNEHQERTRKHIQTPIRKSACKRMNMYLRWMVRSDDQGVDFGLWKKLNPAQLVCPCDVHVERVARKLKIIRKKGVNWSTAIELTEKLRKLDSKDPVKYDFALFGLGVVEKF